jgi:hypothetical protein
VSPLIQGRWLTLINLTLFATFAMITALELKGKVAKPKVAESFGGFVT